MATQHTFIDSITIDPDRVQIDSCYPVELPKMASPFSVAWYSGKLFVWYLAPLPKDVPANTTDFDFETETHNLWIMPSGCVSGMAMAGSVYLGTALIPTQDNASGEVAIVDWHVFHDPLRTGGVKRHQTTSGFH